METVVSNASSLTHQLCWCSRTSVYERVPERDVVSHDCSHISWWNDLLLLRHRCVWEWFRRLKANCSRTCSSHHLQPPSYPPPSCGSHAAIYEVNADDWMCSLRYIWSCSRTCLVTSNAYSKDCWLEFPVVSLKATGDRSQLTLQQATPKNSWRIWFDASLRQ